MGLEGAWHGGTGQQSPFWAQKNCTLNLIKPAAMIMGLNE